MTDETPETVPPELAALRAAQAAAQWSEATRLAEAILMAPTTAETLEHSPHGEALHAIGLSALIASKLPEAEQAFLRSVAANPTMAATHRNLGVVYHLTERKAQAIDAFTRACELEPTDPHSRFNLGVCYMESGRLAEAIAEYRECLARAADHAGAHSNLIFNLDLIDQDAAILERKVFHARHGAKWVGRTEAFLNRPDPERRLRVGYVSGDFSFHSASFLFGPVIREHDRDQFDVTLYGMVKLWDVISDRYRDEFRWRNALPMPDDDFIRQVRGDGIDILVDLSGHSHGNRLTAFARRCAPVQVTAWGHVHGSGLTAMDYLLADRIVVPPASSNGGALNEPGRILVWPAPPVAGLPGTSDPRFSERIVYLPVLCPFGPATTAPDVTPPPVLERGVFTFGTFNRMDKIGAPTLDLWASILQAIPAARLLIKTPEMDRPERRDPFIEALVSRGIDPGRLECRGKTVHFEHLANYRDVDLALDPTPHGGGVTALEALWMGVPVLTKTGTWIPGRLATSFLMALGLARDFAADTDQGVVDLAVKWAGQPQALAALRQGLRQRLQASPLADVSGYTRDVERCYRAMWRVWCRNGGGT